MPQPRSSTPRFAVRFDDLAFTEDLQHATPAGRQVATDARGRLQRDGIAVGELRRCDPEGRDGTRLPNCLKTYLPTLAGAWRMVFELTRDPGSGSLQLTYLAFGIGHPQHPWQPSAYRVAHGRLHATD